MTCDGRRRLLWTDDDAPGRFRYELLMLERSGWTIEWATSLEQALKKLCEDEFDAMLLDQLLPARTPVAPRRVTPNVWHGCRLLYWLRGAEWPSTAPNLEDWDSLSRDLNPPKWRDLPVLLVSNVFDEDVHSALFSLEPALQQVVKPPSVDLLLKLLDHASQRRNGDA